MIAGVSPLLDTGTWRWERSCASWIYELVPAPGQTLLAAMAEGARGTVRVVTGDR